MSSTPPIPDSGEPQQQSERPAERPQPAFGELAPEGWEWKPETGSGGTAPMGEGAPQHGSAAAGSAVPPGVPHNLGVREPGATSTNPAPPAAPTGSTPGDPEPYRAATPQPQQPQFPQGVSGAPGARATQPRTVDRVFTIILLVLGAVGALQVAGSLMGISASFSLVASALDLRDFTVPAWIGTAGTISAVVVIAIYAVALIFSIQRMRARKLAFWVPLTAGAIALIGTIIVTTVLMMNVPELMQAASDPSSTGKLLDYLEEMSQP